MSTLLGWIAGGCALLAILIFVSPFVLSRFAINTASKWVVSETYPRLFFGLLLAAAATAIASAIF